MASGTIGALDVQRGPALSIRPANYVNALVLAATTAESLTVPTTPAARFVRLNSGTERLYYNMTGTAEIAAADVTDGTASATNTGDIMFIGSATAISVIASNACVVTAEFWTD